MAEGSCGCALDSCLCRSTSHSQTRHIVLKSGISTLSRFLPLYFAPSPASRRVAVSRISAIMLGSPWVRLEES